MDNEFVKKVGRETFEKLDKQTQAVILKCSDHQQWLETEQTKLDYICSLAQRYPIYQKYEDGMANEVEHKIQRAFQTLVIEGCSNNMGNSSTPMVNISSNGNSGNSATGSQSTASNGHNGHKQDENSFSLEDDLELSLEGL